MPAEFVEPRGQLLAILAKTQGRHRPGRARRIGGITVDAGATHHLVVQVVVLLQVLIAQRPVVGNAIQGFDFEIRGVQPGAVGGPVNRAPANGVEHERGDRRISVVDRIVLGPAPDIRIKRPVCQPAVLPVVVVGDVVGRVGPAALLKANDVQIRPAQAPRNGGARRSGADYQDIRRPVVSSAIYHAWNPVSNSDIRQHARNLISRTRILIPESGILVPPAAHRHLKQRLARGMSPEVI